MNIHSSPRLEEQIFPLMHLERTRESYIKEAELVWKCIFMLKIDFRVPHPTIILPDYIQASEQVTNCINTYVKIPDSSGKFYVDEEYLDFVYSARISYRYLEAFPAFAVKDGVFGYLPFMADIGNFVFQVAQGQMPAEEACQHIASLWGVES